MTPRESPQLQEVMLRARQAMVNAINYVDAMLYNTRDSWATQRGMDHALLRALEALEVLYRLRTQQGPT